MSLDPELIELMTDEITLVPVVMVGNQPVKDGYNNFQYGTAIPVKCYLVQDNNRALDREGRELISTVQAFLARPELEVTPDWRLILPDGTTPAIIQVLGAKDELGEPYYKEIRA